MTNFSFLDGKKEYQLFSSAAQEAENLFNSSPVMCAVACRKALELAVKWVYSADNSISKAYSNNLSALFHEESFKQQLPQDLWEKLKIIILLGNTQAHSNKKIYQYDVLPALKALFEFIQWIDYSYGANYEPRQFDQKLIPKTKVDVDQNKIKELISKLDAQTAENEALRKQIEELSAKYSEAKAQNQKEREFQPEPISKFLSEFETRKIYIDVDLQEVGWRLQGDANQNVYEEVEVKGEIDGKTFQGRADYVLYGQNGKPLAVVEAKSTSQSPNAGQTQAKLYADCLEKQHGRRPFIFLTNGLTTYFWDDLSGPQRRVSGTFSQDDLEKLMARRDSTTDLLSIKINEKITDRPYQQGAIRAVCEEIQKRVRRHLLVMATGTGKTRTAASLVDVLSRGERVKNVLFLADRVALVQQARDAFKGYLPNMTLCNLCENKDDKNARIVFSTYPTMLNEIDKAREQDGSRSFSPARFDLVIIDESHRSIFKKYKAIFEYFDAILVGLTATPKTEVDHNTYDFFNLEEGVPTYAYDYTTAVEQDHVLVPYYTYEVTTKFLHDGVKYNELSEEDKERFEEAFEDEEFLPSEISASDVNKYFFNAPTVDLVLQDLMTRGIKTEGGERLGKTIIFAQNKKHADFILERFNALYPQYNGHFAKRVICDDAYAQSVIADFKNAEKDPVIVVSVDMMDTGIDVPECVNLVFFKKVFSKIKFWQMIGRGTRLAPDLPCFDQIDGEYIGKKRFLIFDYCGNFEFFRTTPNGMTTNVVKSLSEKLFIKKVQLLFALQGQSFQTEPYQTWRASIVEACRRQIKMLNPSLAAVKMHKEQIDKYGNAEAFANITVGNQAELFAHIAPIILEDESDEFAKRFDSLIYGLILASLGVVAFYTRYQAKLRDIATMLEGKTAIPQVKAKLSEIKKVNTEEYWLQKDILAFEHTRRELRSLVKFIDDDAESRHVVYTKLNDPIIDEHDGGDTGGSESFETYKQKVNRYVEEHADTPAIYNLRHNIPLTEDDYKELERVFTVELGQKEDYQKEFGDTPFGILVRTIVKLDHDAVRMAFSKFINDYSLNLKQISFVDKIINYLEKNGYMETGDLLKQPFDKPALFNFLFNLEQQKALVDAIDSIQRNAVV
ncbi:MAG: DEAD/DEAH box helicase family protein [Thermoguttaceae bacterium]|nr:DEAD/DEAH box helicase family protein [Thermoguttaceae bacterium]